MEWKHVEGYQTSRPKEVDLESSPTTAYMRKNIKEVPNEGEGTHWEYDEIQMPREDFAAYAYSLIIEKQKSMDVTLAEILLNQMEV